MTTASKITLIRVAFIPVYMLLMYLSGGQPGLWMWLGLAVFIIASLTDYVDGHIARKYNQVSDFGKFLDPLADKLLVIAAMTMFCQWGQIPAWALMLVLTREFAVTGLRLVAVGKGKVIAAGFFASFCIEILQLPFFDRASDIDDLILNTAGYVMGYGIYLLVRKIRKKNRP